MDEDGRGFVEFAGDGADRMRATIERLFQYSRVDAGGESVTGVHRSPLGIGASVGTTDLEIDR